MSARRIDDELRRYYADQAMSAETIARIRAAAERARRPPAWRRVAAIAAACAVAILAGLLLVNQYRDGAAPREIARASDADSMAIAHRLADRHENCLVIDYRGDDLAAVLAQIGDLGFEPALPPESMLEGARLVGAHACVTEGGERALHATYTDARGERLSLFEFPIPADVHPRETMVTHNIGAYEVTLVPRAGLLIGIARVAS